MNDFHIKTHLSKLVARLKSINRNKDVSLRIGIAEGEFAVPENIDGGNEVIGGFFQGNIGKDFLRRN